MPVLYLHPELKTSPNFDRNEEKIEFDKNKFVMVLNRLNLFKYNISTKDLMKIGVKMDLVLKSKYFSGILLYLNCNIEVILALISMKIILSQIIYSF